MKRGCANPLILDTAPSSLSCSHSVKTCSCNRFIAFGKTLFDVSVENPQLDQLAQERKRLLVDLSGFAILRDQGFDGLLC